MNRLLAAVAAGVCAAALLGGCDRGGGTPEAPPAPQEVAAEDVGHYCGMLLSTHEGPKGQIHLAGRGEPVWFSSVRDTIAFLRLPEEPRDIAAIYVNDMALATDWAQPEPGTWTDARTAWYVIESDQRGGMGAPEAVPFSDRGAAEAFRQSHGGRLVRLDDIPDGYVLGPVDLSGADTGHGEAAHGQGRAHEEASAGPGGGHSGGSSIAPSGSAAAHDAAPAQDAGHSSH